MTQAELGALLHCTQPAVSQLENDGPAVHDVRTLRRVARALGVPLAILVVEDDEEADMDRRNFLRASALGAGMGLAVETAGRVGASTTSVRIGAEEVADIAADAGRIHDLDLVVGGDRLCGLAAGYVRHVRNLLDTAVRTDEVGRSLTSAAAEVMTAAGWVHYDAGRPERARRYYADAAEVAAAAGDGFAAAHALGNASGYLVDQARNRPDRTGDQLAVQYARAATRAAARRGGPKLRALMALRESEAYGARGDKAELSRAISRALRARGSAHGHDPAWVYLPEAEISGIMGKAHMWLGDHATATTHFRDAVAGSAAWPRERASWELHLARSLIQAGEVDGACALLLERFDTIAESNSERLRRRMDELGTAVRRHVDVSEAREFLGRLSEKI